MSTMSDIYYEGLGVQNPEQYRRFVMLRMDEYRAYLDKAIYRMKKHNFSFRFKPYRSLSKISPDKDKPDAFSLELFYDKELKKKATVNVDKKELHGDPQAPPDSVYGVKDSVIYEYECKTDCFIIHEIEPANAEEDEEDEALELLFHSREVFGSEQDSKAGKRGKDPIDFKIINRKKRQALIGIMPPSDRIWTRLNAYILEKQKESIEKLCLRPRPHHKPLLNLMQRDNFVSWDTVEGDALDDDKFIVLTDKDRSGCGEQRDFVRKALNSPDFAILEGPPGSGKTTTLLEIIAQVIKSGEGKRVLMVASTHVAVDNILERLCKPREIKGRTTDLICECGIIPLRIGEEGNVSEDARPFCMNNRIEAEKKRIIGHLERLMKTKGLSESQEGLYRDLISDSKKASAYIQCLLLSCSNFVCGTSIGVLQAPMIKASITTEKLFDLVILDEASKTTFQEFLVPALYGERWILSGDVKQLAPYVESSTIRHNIKAIPAMSDPMDCEVCTSAFDVSAWSENHDRAGLLIVRDEDDISDFSDRMEKQIDGLNKLNLEHGISFFGIKRVPRSDDEKLKLFGANLIVVSRRLLQEVIHLLPPKLDTEEFLSAQYRRRAAVMEGWREVDRQCWDDAIQWRLCRLHELQLSSPKHSAYEMQIKALLPYYESNDGKDRTRKRNVIVESEINRIKSIALPSILTLLQKGFDSSKMPSDAQNIALYAGLSYNGTNKRILQERHTLLTFQHRMHPEISEFPRKEIYEDKALEPAKGLIKERAWPGTSPFPNYTYRSVWVDVRPERHDVSMGRSNYNIAEIKRMMKKLKTFMEWSKKHRKTGSEKGEKWEVAMLSFYKGQSKRITSEMRKIKSQYGFDGEYDEYTSDSHNVTVKVCTVDRFQGQEGDVVFLSFVRAGKQGIGFLDNVNRLNVAITRAKYQLVIFGDKKRFQRAKNAPVLQKLAEVTSGGEIDYGSDD